MLYSRQNKSPNNGFFFAPLCRLQHLENWQPFEDFWEIAPFSKQIFPVRCTENTIVLYCKKKIPGKLGDFMTLTAEELAFFNHLLREVANRTDLLQTDRFIQHGDTSTLWHSIAVAYYSLWLARRLRLACRWKSLVSGALLHDYFLYDWHIPAPDHRFHGFTHPRAALRNAQRDWQLDAVQQNIIIRHMFPLTPVPPLCREGLLVCLVDKGCSLAETFRRRRYQRLRTLCAGALRKGGASC